MENWVIGQTIEEAIEPVLIEDVLICEMEKLKAALELQEVLAQKCPEGKKLTFSVYFTCTKIEDA